MEKPIISVLLPVYNAELFIEESVESILNQSFDFFELLVINDGTTDSSIKIIKKNNDNRIRIINNSHDFINSLNIGLKEAKGKYIARMDTDDLMHQDRLKIQFDFMENNPKIDICGSWGKMFGRSSRKIESSINHHDLICNMLLYNPMIHPSIIMKKSIVENNKYKYGYPCAEDYKLWTDLAMRGYKFANIPEVLLYYRCSQLQVTVQNAQIMNNSTLRIQEEYASQMIDKLIQENKPLKNFLLEFRKLLNNQTIGTKQQQHILFQLLSSKISI